MKTINNKIIMLDELKIRLAYKSMLLQCVNNIINSILQLLKNNCKNNDFIAEIISNSCDAKKQLNYVFNIEANFGFEYLVQHFDKMIRRLTNEYVEADTHSKLIDIASRLIILERYITHSF